MHSSDSIEGKLLSIPENSCDSQKNEHRPPCPIRANLISLCIALAMLFHIQFQFTVYVNSLWPFLLSLDPGAGAVVTPIFGKLYNRFGTKIPVIIGLILIAWGNIVLAFVHLFSIPHRKWAVLISRLIGGAGSGAMAAVFAYTIDVTSGDTTKRRKVVAARSIVQSLAMMLGPLLQVAAVPVGRFGWKQGIVRLNMYTTPAYVSAGISFIGVIVVIFYFRNLPPKKEKLRSESGKTVEKFDKLALWVSSWVRTVHIFVIGYTMSIASPLSMVMFGWDDVKTVWLNSLFMILQGVFVIPTNLFVAVICMKHIRERAMMCIGLVLVVLAFLIAFPWPWYPLIMSTVYDHLEENRHLPGQDIPTTFNATTFYFEKASTTVHPFNLLPNVSADFNSTSYLHFPFNQTCNYSWCSRMNIMPFGSFIALILLLFLSNSICKVPTAVLYANILGQTAQGVWQGIFSCSEMIGMGAGPLASGFLFEYFGPQVVFAVAGAATIAAIVPFLCFTRE